MDDIDIEIREAVISSRKRNRLPLLRCPFPSDASSGYINCAKYCGYLFPEWLESNRVSTNFHGEIMPGSPHPCHLLGEQFVVARMKEKYKDLYEKD